MSWITLYSVGAFSFAILGSLGSSSIRPETFWIVVLGIPFMACIFGLIGLGIDSIRVGKAEYYGWYWWLFPVITYLWLGLMIAMIPFAIAGIKLPSNPQQRHSKFNPDQLRREFPNLKVKDILKDFEKELKQLEEQGGLEPKQKNVLRKLRQFDGSKYNSRLQDVFEDNELEELVRLILILLGVEIR